MGSRYAAILGVLAFVTVAVRGLVHGSTAEPTLLAAALSAVVALPLGYLAGAVARKIVHDSIRAQITAELSALRIRGE